MAYQGTLAAMTPWSGLIPLAKGKCWVGILALSGACLAHSGSMCQDNKNALPKLGMWPVSEGWRKRGIEGGRVLILMAKQENRLFRGTCKQSLVPGFLLLSTVTHCQYILGTVLGQGKGGAKPEADGKA